jgi:transcription initiation factor TFIIB
MRRDVTTWRRPADTAGRGGPPGPEFHALRRQVRERQSKRGRTYALGEMDRMASALGVSRPSREIAKVVYRRASDRGDLRGRSIEGVGSAALYAGCRKEGVPRSLGEIAAVSRADAKEIGRTYRYLADTLGLGLEPADPTEYIPRYCESLDVGPSVERTATEIAKTTAEKGLLSGKSPTGYAAAAIYAAATVEGVSLTQRAIADVSQVTEVTIRSRYKEQLGAFEGAEAQGD